MLGKLPIVAPVAVPAAGSRDSFIARAYDFSVLDANEEYALAIRYHEYNDLEAAQKLIVHNMRFVIQIARGYGGYGLPLSDLIQEGSIGLMKAVKKFDPDIGVRLVSFAVHWIRAEIHEFILRNWRIVKVATTKAQRKLFFNLRSMKKRIAWLNQEEVREVSKQLGVKPEEVIEMESRLSGKDVSFDPLIEDSESEESYTAPAAYLADSNADPAQLVEDADWRDDCQRRFQVALQKIDKRSREILKARWFSENKATLQELAEKYQVSAERIRQIETEAIKQLRKLAAAA